MLYKILEIELKKGIGKLTVNDYKSVTVQYGNNANNYFILKEMYSSVFVPIRNNEYEKIERANLEKS